MELSTADLEHSRIFIFADGVYVKNLYFRLSRLDAPQF